MNLIKHIAATQGNSGANSASAAGKALSQQDLDGFTNILASQPSAQSASSAPAKSGAALTAKISAYLKDHPAIAAKLQSQMQNSAAASSKDGDVAASRTSDLAAQLATLLQGDDATSNNADLMNQLQGMLNTNIQNAADQDVDAPAADANTIAQFRTDAIKLMKSMGMSDADIEKTLLQFAMNNQSALSNAQTAQLVMPVQSEKLASLGKLTADDKDNDNGQMAAVLSAAPKMQPAVNAAPAADYTAAGNGANKVQAPNAAPQQNNAPQAAPQQQPQDTSAKAKPATETSHIALVNAMASNDSNSGNSMSGDTGSNPFSQNDASATNALTGTQSASAATPGSFVNYMNTATQAAPGASAATTQMVALQIQQNLAAKVNTFNMQLHPAELGGLEIRLKFGKDGVMKAQLIADKPETLSMLQKDSAQLNRILQGAGVNADESSLSFDLRQQNQQRGEYQPNNNSASRSGGYGDDLDATIPDNALMAKIAVNAAGYISQRGVNIMV